MDTRTRAGHQAAAEDASASAILQGPVKSAGHARTLAPDDKSVKTRLYPVAAQASVGAGDVRTVEPSAAGHGLATAGGGPR
jgi:hypothetical protein